VQVSRMRRGLSGQCIRETFRSSVRSRRWGRLEASSGGVIGSILALSFCRFSPTDTILFLNWALGGGPGGRRAAAPAAGPPAGVVLPRCCLLRGQVPEQVPSRGGSLVNLRLPLGRKAGRARAGYRALAATAPRPPRRNAATLAAGEVWAILLTATRSRGLPLVSFSGFRRRALVSWRGGGASVR